MENKSNTGKLYFKSISDENDFNTKYKNLLRDFYVYNFKTKQEYYRSRDNKEIGRSTFQNYSLRLQSIMTKKLGVEWTEDPYKKNKKSISIDSSILEYNPFFELYLTHFSKEKYVGAYYLILILLVFEINQVINPIVEVSDEEKKLIVELVKNQLLFLYSEEKHSQKQSFRNDSYETIDSQTKLRIFDVINNRFYKSSYLSEEDTEENYELIELYNKMKKAQVELKMDEKGHFDFFRTNTIPKQGLYNAFCELSHCDDMSYGNFKLILDEYKAMGVISINDDLIRINNSLFPTDNLNRNFRYRFIECIKFFSETAPLGVVGFFVLRKFENFRSNLAFKHNYLYRALNDFNIIDLLFAIENKKWVLLEYRNAAPAFLEDNQDLAEQTIGNITNKICMPLEIRESTTDGKQFLLAYNPYTHSIEVIRIDFIERITFGNYSESEELTIVKEIEYAKNRLPYVMNTDIPIISGGNVRINNEGKEVKWPENIVEVVLFYNEKEGFIPRKVKRELALSKEDAIIKGKKFVNDINFSYGGNDDKKFIRIVLKVAVLNDCIKWVRTFERRIIRLTINGKESLDFRNDILKICTVYSSKIHLERIFGENEKEKEIICGEIDIDKFIIEKNIRYPHELLFNNYFNGRLEEIAKFVLLGMKKKNNHLYKSYDSLKKARDELVGKLRQNMLYNIGQDDEERLIDHLNAAESMFVDSDLEYNSSLMNEKLLLKLFPLTELEKRWIVEVLNDERAKWFLSKKEIEETLKEFDCSIKNVIFRFNSYKCFNQYNTEFEYKEINKSREIFRTILSATRKKFISVQYYAYGELRNEKIMPIKIEYSKRDDIFRVYGYSDEGIYIFNLERIISCKEDKPKPKQSLDDFNTIDSERQDLVRKIIKAINTDKKLIITFKLNRRIEELIPIEISKEKDQVFLYAFCLGVKTKIYLDDIAELRLSSRKNPVLNFEDALSCYLKSQKQEMIVRFTNANNTPDRLLNEFSTWQKECIYDDETGFYTMKLFYYKMDSFEIATRLLGYGRDVVILFDGGSVKDEYVKRIYEQRDLLNEKILIEENVKENADF